MNFERLRRSLIQHEGWKKFPYNDTENQLTIGVGHNLTAKGLPPIIIKALLDYDIGEAVNFLQVGYPWTNDLDEVRTRVLAEMMFNLGPTRFAGFVKMIAAVKAGDYDQAAVEMLDSKWARQVGARATTLAEMMRTGKEPGE